MKKDLIAEYKTVISALYPNLKHSSIDEVNLEWTQAWKIIENTPDPKKSQKLIILRRQLTGIIFSFYQESKDRHVRRPIGPIGPWISAFY